ncbi:MAG: GNAT family N-acetyltransferase [Bacillota bacterium]
MPLLQTERLLLRKFRLSDLNDLYEYAKDPKVGPDAGWDYHRSKDESLLILNKFIKSTDTWAIVLKENSKVIGSIGLHRDRKRDNKSARMMGYVMNPLYWSQGYATEAARRIVSHAFEVLEVDIVSAYHYPHNERSGNVILKCGFTCEGTLKAATVTYDGLVHDELCYAITRDEYMKNM